MRSLTQGHGESTSVVRDVEHSSHAVIGNFRREPAQCCPSGRVPNNDVVRSVQLDGEELSGPAERQLTDFTTDRQSSNLPSIAAVPEYDSGLAIRPYRKRQKLTAGREGEPAGTFVTVGPG